MAGHGADATAELPGVDPQALRERVRELQQALDAGDDRRAETLLDDITRIRESTLFREMGVITRHLHEALVGLQMDPQLATLCEHGIPDARQRLDYVMAKTEAAAHRTLAAVEDAVPVCSALGGESDRLRESWQRFQRRELSAEEFRGLTRELDDFLASVNRDTRLLNTKLSEVLLAQDFQDLTGQVIRRVLDLVQDVQGHLVQLVRARGRQHGPAAPAPTPVTRDPVKAEGPQVGALPAAKVVQSQDDVDDLLSSLGF